MYYPPESGQIMFLLNSAEWGEITDEIERLKEKKQQLKEAENAFGCMFTEVEHKRKDAFKKRLAHEKVGICQHHWQHTYVKTRELGIFPGDLFPLDKLKIVTGEDLGTKILCEECIAKLPRFVPKYVPPRLKTEVKGTPTTNDVIGLLSTQQLRDLEFHFKMPCLHEFMEFYEAEMKKKESV